MKNETVLNQTTLQAAVAVHEAITADDAFWGYDGTIESFATLLAEVQKVAEYLIEPINAQNVDAIVETWFEVQNEIAEGNLDVDWYLNPETALVNLVFA
jgi:hypothetical protein